MSVSEERQLQVRQAIVDACLEMNSSGLNHGTSGNISARVDDLVLITPSGVPYRDLRPHSIVPLRLDGSLDSAHELLPSSEWRMHIDLYCRDDVGAVVHTHSTYATALSCLNVGVPPFHYMVAMAGGHDIRCADYATFGTPELSESMLQAIEGRKACLLANHGVIATGMTLAKAFALAGEVEALCRQYLIARSVGTPVLLSPAEMDTNLAKFATYGLNAPQLR
jgi:L-fuculose-phosphate aldolase